MTRAVCNGMYKVRETSVRADKRITITKEAPKSVLRYGENQRFQWGLQTLQTMVVLILQMGGFTDDWKGCSKEGKWH